MERNTLDSAEKYEKKLNYTDLNKDSYNVKGQKKKKLGSDRSKWGEGILISCGANDIHNHDEISHTGGFT